MVASLRRREPRGRGTSAVGSNLTENSAPTGNLVEHAELFFRKVAYPMYDVSSKVFWTDHIFLIALNGEKQ
jgi:hypothetical protein